jgi:hypothetical protein
MTNTARLLNTSGLALTSIGCLLLFSFGLPVDVDLKGRVNLIGEQSDAAEIAKGRRYLWWGRLGISLIALGSLLQICATWC